MTENEKILLSLIQRALFENTAEILPDADWSAVLFEARQQAVTGVAAMGLPSGLPQQERAAWKAEEYQQLANSVRYWNAQDQLHSLLTENGISYVILKGASAAMLYPQPLRRRMGDIDFLVPPEQFGRAQELLFAHGYQPGSEAGVRHVGLKKDGVSYELHKQFSYLDLDMEDILISGISRAEVQSAEGHKFYSLPAVENGLVLLSHLWNHLHTGVGLRQVIDWMMYVHRVLDDELWTAAFSKQAELLGLKTLAVTAAHMCQMYLGLPATRAWCADADEALCEELFAKVMEYGNFGRKQAVKDPDVRKAQGVLSEIHRYGIFVQLQRRGEVNWEAYHRHPWLKPFAWCYQMFRYPILWFRSQRTQKLSALVKKENETSDLLKRLGKP